MKAVLVVGKVTFHFFLSNKVIIQGHQLASREERLPFDLLSAIRKAMRWDEQN